MNFLENITFRRTRTHSDSNNLNEQMSTTLDETDLDESLSNSLPDLSKTQETNLVISLREQIEVLQLKLNRAHKEIESLSKENLNLREVNQNLTKKNDFYKTITSTPIENTQKETSLSTRAAGEVTQCTPIIHESRQVASLMEQNIKSNVPSINKNKLCIISSNKTCNIRSIAENSFPHLSICHYLSTNCGLQQLLSNLNVKLTNYTLEDYCIIFIGEKDFIKSNNYSELVTYVRETLMNINHTNVILCLPTYKCNNFSVMYNWRIEMFSYLLYHDTQIYKYATLLDSNLSLAYDYSMFSKYTGALNNHGMTVIFDDLMYCVSNLASYSCASEDSVYEKDKLSTIYHKDYNMTNKSKLFR